MTPLPSTVSPLNQTTSPPINNWAAHPHNIECRSHGFDAANDFVGGNWNPGWIGKIGVELPDAVSLILAPYAPDDMVPSIEDLRQKMTADDIEVSVEFDGEELPAMFQKVSRYKRFHLLTDNLQLNE
ncbi:hypothetical protein [Granulosicoccus antarcticus]|uniref:Uncharacterized protein n=1 Tax=Granulosicoccus antarcticus IMCC3135 TaxID=1192854 RepID=A0A2Z2NQ45_9GAMM|nr:hypothetical protein [Granulosicoccus antarcticus]ASJ72081.1 hypothetical protein IMCC3135_09935 [Granulosicoccus antarcticus IMCC3135]